MAIDALSRSVNAHVLALMGVALLIAVGLAAFLLGQLSGKQLITVSGAQTYPTEGALELLVALALDAADPAALPGIVDEDIDRPKPRGDRDPRPGAQAAAGGVPRPGGAGAARRAA